MAIYQTNFGGYALDVAPNDWTARWVTSSQTWAVKAKSGAAGGQVLEHTASATARRLLSWDTVDGDASRADVEILARFRSSYSSSSATEQARLHARSSGAAGSEEGYFVNYWASITLSSTKLDLVKYVGGSATVIASVSSVGYSANEWYWIRFRVNGTSQKAKVWKDGTNEPATWIVEATDSSIAAAGWIGAGAAHSSGTRDWDFVNIATGGDTAVIDNSNNALQLSHAPLEALLSGDPAAQVYQAPLEILVSIHPPELALYHAALEVLVPYTGEEPPAGPKYVVVNIVT